MPTFSANAWSVFNLVSGEQGDHYILQDKVDVNDGVVKLAS